MNPDKHPFTPTLLRWYAANGRDLPWRHTSDPYPIWLSEVIMQQTRISQGMAYWERFMDRFPTVAHLAEAEEDEVLRLWQGLGYYSRARNLHAAAKQVVAAGGFPHSVAGLRELKGVGDYTACAIASFAFGEPAAVVDGNVYRVLSRYFGIDTPIDSSEGKKAFKQLAQDLLATDTPADYNQAIMDFGALVCTPAAPSCDRCPLQESCEALRTHRTGTLPVKAKRTVQRKRHLIYIYIRHKGETAFRKRPLGDIWAGLWEPLLIESDELPPVEGHLLLLTKGVRHQLTHQDITADFYLWEVDERPPLPAGYQWMKEEEAAGYGHSRLIDILLERLGEFVPEP